MVWARLFRVYWYVIFKSAPYYPLSTCFFLCLLQQYHTILTLECPVRQDSVVEIMNKSSVVEPRGWPQNSHGKQVNSRENQKLRRMENTHPSVVCWGTKKKIFQLSQFLLSLVETGSTWWPSAAALSQSVSSLPSSSPLPVAAPVAAGFPSVHWWGIFRYWALFSVCLSTATVCPTHQFSRYGAEF